MPVHSGRIPSAPATLASAPDGWDDDFDDSLFEAAAREIMSNNGYTPDMLTGSNGSALIRETFRHFDKAISVGLTETVDPKVSSALRENAFVFSGFKTHAELEQVSQLLTDKNGNIRPFNQFLNDVQRLNATYNHAYLRSEYNQAVQAAQMAGKWQDFEKHKDSVNLQYRTANDERVRASHRILHGTTLPVDDPFWDKYTPPNGWNCRCTVVKVLKEDYPESDPQGSTANAESCFKTPKDSIFKTNPGKTLKLFPEKHPYLPKGCGNCKYKGGKLSLSGYDPNRPFCQVCQSINGDYFINKCVRDTDLKNVQLKAHLVSLTGKCKDHNGQFQPCYINKYGFEECIKKMTTADTETYILKNEIVKQWPEYLKRGRLVERKTIDHHNSENPKNKAAKWKKNCTAFSYYEITVKGIDFYLNVIHHKNGSLYLWTITTKIPEYD